MLNYILIFTFLCSAAIVLNLLPKIIYLSAKKNMLDRVGERHLSNSMASRLGGISFVPAIFLSTFLSLVAFDYFGVVSLSLFALKDLLLIFSSIVILYLAGVYDDLVGMRYKRKLIWQLISALLFLLSGCYVVNFDGLFGLNEISPYVGADLH